MKLTQRQGMEALLQFLKEVYPDIYEGMRNTLKYYDEVHLTYENGRYEYSAGFGIKAKYAPDYRAWPAFDKSFFNYTEEELVKAKEELSQVQWF